MGIFSNWFKPKNDGGVDLNSFFGGSNSGSMFNSNPLGDVTYFTCLKILSEALSKLSIHLYDNDNNRIYDHNIIKLLNERPNEFMTPSTFKQVVEFNRNHKGNSYIYIQYKAGKVIGLYPLKSNAVDVVINDTDNVLPKIIYRYNGSKEMFFLPNEIIHLKGGYSEDGLKGKSIVATLKSAFSLSNQSDRLMDKMYQNGLMGKTVVKTSDALNETKRKELIKRLHEMLQDSNNEFVSLPMNTELQTLNVNLNNSQFAELKKYTSNQIAAAFGISPVYLNDYSKSSFSSSEAQNLSFYTDTMLAILKQYEEELNYKLLTEKERDQGLTLRFNLAGVLRGDLKSQSEAIQTLVGNGVYKINEARALLSMPKIEEGDTSIINGSFVKLADIGLAYKGGDSNDTDTE
ncbi:phage portal protein [Pseudostreptobacillus hongkongensis]|uniref:phage portal protein n=1 Tax=Pseudostreptobacillus hongkongensis TaxID=1162717 RepID=UPI000833D296|nr:phage portal protein [Pseudostreptobacillus hongkongensis]